MRSAAPPRCAQASCLQAKYGSLQQGHPGVSSDPLPTLDQVKASVSAAKQLTVRDVWGLMLTCVPGAWPACWLCPWVLPAPQLPKAHGDISAADGCGCRAGVGSEAAEAILQAFPTPLSLFQAYQGAARRARAHGLRASAVATQVLHLHLQAANASAETASAGPLTWQSSD